MTQMLEPITFSKEERDTILRALDLLYEVALEGVAISPDRHHPERIKALADDIRKRWYQ